MSSFANQYFQEVITRLERIQSEQMPAIDQAADLIAAAIADGKRLFAFGVVHSALPVQDLVYRGGGLMLVNPIFLPGLASLEIRPINLSTDLERVSGLAKSVLEHSPVQAGDVMIIVSVAGRNAAPIEMALEAQARGLKVIAVTSLAYSAGVSSRHPSGKKLNECADVVIDDLVDLGDAVLSSPDIPQKFCPVAGPVNTALMQALIAAAIEKLLEGGITPPIFMAANLEGGDEYNRRMLEQYKDRIFYM